MKKESQKNIEAMWNPIEALGGVEDRWPEIAMHGQLPARQKKSSIILVWQWKRQFGVVSEQEYGAKESC
jgi:hypothetical protein